MTVTRKLDCRSRPCPEPLLRAISSIREIEIGDSIEIWVRTPAAREDIEKWAEKADQKIVLSRNQGDRFILIIERTK
ncbi:MAG TPA: sulfurtransferase TusA family protein [Conexivisphaerales archaeon]|nr:sulfurtransferase TusA family protein [Conexivisphaerales archaeon]